MSGTASTAATISCCTHYLANILPIDGDPPGGHHRKGVLRFAPIAPVPDAVELRLQRPGESAPRSFTWTLK